ncbi:MAG TPA: hypothetical protein VGS22_26680 [Thermoanaerobaculia bacterium]|nr:hypothetical protein [Thermoanaerobaculia bacterium]
MKATASFFLFGTALLSAAFSLNGQAPSLIEPKFERRQGPPLWVSAQEVSDPKEIIKLDLIDDFHLRKSVEAQRLGKHTQIGDSVPTEKPEIASISRPDCTTETLSAELRGGEGPSETLADLAEYSKSIVRGSIRSLDLGFASGEPSLLVGLEVSESIKGGVLGSLIYIGYPVARFRIGSLIFCNAERGFEPSLGDQVMLFDYTGPIDREGSFYSPRLDQLFFQSQSGQLFLPPHLKASSDLAPARSLGEVAKLLLNNRKDTKLREDAQ